MSESFGMRRISSRMTFFHKRIFPALWFGGLLLFLVFVLPGAIARTRGEILPVLFVPVFMGGLGYFLFRKLLFDLVDEVFDTGDSLLVKNGGQEERISFADIMNVSYTTLVSPPRVTLSLRRPSIFGMEIAFCAPTRFVPFTRSPIIDELIERIDAARR